MLRSIRIGLTLVFMALISTLISAQDELPAQLVVSYAEVTEGQNEVSELGLYFTFADGAGRPMPADTGGDDATIVVSGNDINLTQEARVEEPNTPLFVVIVLDASGSMQASANDMRRAAIEAVNALPDGTQFSLIVFNKVISSATEFSRDKNSVINLIGTYQPARPSDANAGTCLFDATFAAIDRAVQAELPARRTVLLFTDGRDELTAGRGDTCSTHTLNEVITKATNINNPVAINAVGLRGAVAIDEASLRSMAESSKGFAAIGALSELSSLFQVIVDGLNNQRVALADFCLPRGQYTATLLAGAGFNSPQLSDTFNFTTDLQCTPATPTPVAEPIIRFTGKAFDRATEMVTLQLGGENLDQITRYSVFVSDPSGSSIGEFIVNGGPDPEPITFSMAGLPDGRIRIDVVAIRFNGENIETDDELSVLRPTPTPLPTATLIPTETPIPTLVDVGVNVQSIQYNAATDAIRLDIVYTESEQVARVRIDIIDGRGFNKVSQDRAELIQSVEFIARDIGLIPDEQYTVRVEAFNAANQSLNRVEQNFTYDPARTPTPIPTNTPEPSPTATAVVFTADIDAIGYDVANDLLEIRLTLENGNQMGDLELLVLDANNVLVDTILVDAVTPIQYSGAKLIPQARYTFRLKATDLNGRVVATNEFQNFAYPRAVTATPSITPTITPSLTPTNAPTGTPVLTQLEFVGLDYRAAEKVLAVQFNGTNMEQIALYRLVLNDGGGVIIHQQEILPDATEFNIPLDLTTGDFEVVVTALDAQGQPLASFDRSFKLNVPTPTPTPAPSLIDRIRENPVVGILIGVIVLALIGLLIFLLSGSRRDKNKNKTTASSLPSMTGAQIIMPQNTNKPASSASGTPSFVDTMKPPSSSGSNLDEPTMRPNAMVSDKTNAALGGMSDINKTNASIVASAFLQVRESGDSNMNGKVLPLMGSPFTIGRSGPRNNSANFDGDKNISRAHAEIVLDNGIWTLIDNGSALGTTVNDGAKITGRIPLGEGDVIRLGSSTVLVFTRKG